MANKLGQHWIRTHPDERDYSHVERMQYPSTKLFEWHWSNRDACRDLLAVLPKDAYILARDHPMSEQKGDMWADPIGTGTRHANEWAFKVAGGNVHTPTDRTFFLGINEPDATNGDRAAIDRYTTAFLDRLKVHGLRGGAFNFSTGHPRTVDGTGNTQADYTVFEGSHQAIVRGNHIAVAHIYGSSTQPCVPGHYDRLKACTWQDVQWVIGECGSDEHVTTGGAHDGYLRTMNPTDYCRWLDELIMGINDPRIHSYQVFTYDFSHPWDSFDIRPIRDALEAYDWQHVKQAPPVVVDDGPATIHLPSISNGSEFYVSVPAGANIRSAPQSGTVLTAVPYGEHVQLIGIDTLRPDWAQVRYGDVQGWMYRELLSAEKPVTVDDGPQVPPPTGDNWSRAYPEVLRFEGGLSLDPNDTGNWYNGKLVGTKYGISAAVWGGQYDIPNLTKEQALEIYRKHYWEASGADKLPWPMCLIVFDTAINHGVGVAQKLLNYKPTPEEIYLGQRMLRYVDDPKWRHFGEAWGVRVDNLQDIAEASA